MHDRVLGVIFDRNESAVESSTCMMRVRVVGQFGEEGGRALTSQSGSSRSGARNVSGSEGDVSCAPVHSCRGNACYHKGIS